jgi:undecaprenyl-diphosphatase
MEKDIRRRLSPDKVLNNSINTAREFGTELLFTSGLLLCSLLLLFFLVHSVIPEQRNIIDQEAFLFLKPLISKDHTRYARMVTFFGTGSFLIPSYVFIVFYLFRKNYRKYGMLVSTIVISSLLLGWILKPLFHRARPPYPLVNGAGGYSFPSGHALGGFIFSGVLLYLVWNTCKNIYLKWCCSLCVLLFGMMIGLSRVYLHVHYATDVMGSFLLTLAWFSFICIFFRFIYKHEMHERELPENTSDLLPEGLIHSLNKGLKNFSDRL